METVDQKFLALNWMEADHEEKIEVVVHHTHILREILAAHLDVPLFLTTGQPSLLLAGVQGKPVVLARSAHVAVPLGWLPLG